MAAEEKKHWLEPPEWWKKAKPLRWLAILGILFVAFSVLYTAKMVIAPSAHPETAKFTAGVADPVAMIGPLKSYDSVGSVRSALDQTKVKYAVTPVRPRATSKYPPRDTDTIVAKDYTHLGMPGQLTLEFFNDRLFEATFVPDDLDDYVPKLHAAEPRLKREKDGRTDVSVGNLRLATNVDFASTDTGRNLQTRPFVVWQDLRLTTLLDEWDRRFVALPGKAQQ
ncbi:MAG: hypothetical protein ACT4PK_04060 [Gammaproteobacteria bacterium]